MMGRGSVEIDPDCGFEPYGSGPYGKFRTAQSAFSLLVLYPGPEEKNLP
jgi:hypothetical protein